ncbi:uncharacterized protein AC631_00502 [Debaryomyces fabryi]|uniref:pH-response transcription factor pacC/RIM101 n=1 Tax=Debaryomyces fabryi TaxID=58627 RepID=A0A0V1Q5Q3_9ASCO|nr:uncharacterized protein AC631_00502 [Debaryomyces fabryi]KSA03690.1 hypothetical protein AC631_00502 [Debaryomyces fabryi]CUM53441.1 unnamed protein product [Debaryomyces fabryi]
MSKEDKITRPKRYQCPVKDCSKMYSRPCLLEQHRRTHTNERNFVCDIPGCGKNFLRKSHLKVHKWSHSSEKPLSCEICHRGFTTSQQLARHLNTHPRDKICPYDCGKTFLIDEDLIGHMLDEHVLNEIVILQESPGQKKDDNSLFSATPTLDSPGDFILQSNTRYRDPATSSLEDSDSNIVLHLKDKDSFVGLHCMEDICEGFDAYDSVFDLIQHYDEYHHFVPDSYFREFK